MIVNARSVSQKVLVHRETHLDWSVSHQFGLNLGNTRFSAASHFVGTGSVHFVVCVTVGRVAGLASHVANGSILKRQIITLHTRIGIGMMLTRLNRVRPASNTIVETARHNTIVHKVLPRLRSVATITSKTTSLTAREYILRREVNRDLAVALDAGTIGERLRASKSP